MDRTLARLMQICYRQSEDGGGGGGGTKTEDPPAPTTPEQRPSSSKTFVERMAERLGIDDPEALQAEITKLAARERDQGQESGRKEIIDELGLDLETAKATIAKQKAIVDQQKSEAEKEREAAEKEKADAKKEKEEAARERHAIKLERRLISEGMPVDKVERYARLVDVDTGAADDAIAEAVTTLKESEPILFQPTNDPDMKMKPKVRGSDPPKGPTKPQGGEDMLEAGKKLAAQRQGRSKE